MKLPWEAVIVSWIGQALADHMSLICGAAAVHQVLSTTKYDPSSENTANLPGWPFGTMGFR